MNNVNVILVDSSTITPTHPYIVYISSVSIPGRIATVRDATGYLSTPNRIIVSTLKDILISPNISTFTITQPYGYISLSSRDANTWNIINTFAFPDPQGTPNVSSLYVNDGINATSLFATAYISTAYVNTYSISSFNLVASNAISTGYLQANLISTNTLRAYGTIKSDRLRVSTISSYFTYANYISSGSISSGTIATDILSTGLLYGASLSTANITANILAANTISTGLLNVNSISSVNIAASIVSSGLFIAPSLSSVNIAANIVAANSISTGVLNVNSISSVNIAASNISSSVYVGNSILTNTLLANNISSVSAKISSLTTSSIALQSGTGIGYITASSDGTNILYNAKPIGTFISTATGDLFMSTYTLRTSTILTSSISLRTGSNTGVLSISANGSNLLVNSVAVSGAWVGTATSALNMNTFAINNAGGVTSRAGFAMTEQTYGTVASISYANPTFTNPIVTINKSLSVAGFNIYNVSTVTLQGTGTSNGILQLTADAQTLKLNGSNVGGWIGTASSGLNMNNNSISNVSTVVIKSGVGSGTLQTSSDGLTLYFNSNAIGGGGAGWVGTAASDLNMNNFNILNAKTVSTLSLSTNAIKAGLLNVTSISSIAISTNTLLTSSIAFQSGVTAGLLAVSSDGQTLKLNGSNVGGGTWVPTATSDLNMNQYNISNVNTIDIKTGATTGSLTVTSDGQTLQLNGSNVGSGSGSSGIQTFTSAISESILNTAKSESNYLYFKPSEKIWKISATVCATLSNTNNTFQFYFTLSNPYLKLEQPLNINTAERPFVIDSYSNWTGGMLQNLSFTFNDTVNMGKFLEYNSNFAPLALNMYFSQTGGGFSNVGNNTWITPSNLSDMVLVNGIAYGNNTWMAVGVNNTEPGVIATSYDDGLTWVGQSVQNDVKGIAYGNGIWVATGAYSGVGTCAIYSTDGVNFLPTNNDYDDGASIAYGNGVFVIAGVTGVLAYSRDGLDWGVLASGVGSLTGVAYGNGLFTAVGNSNSGTSIVTSQDGSNWFANSGNLASYVCVAYGNGRWFAADGGVGGSGQICYSDDNWAHLYLVPAPDSIISIAVGDRIVAARSEGTISYSSNNGIDWDDDALIYHLFNSVAYGNGTFIAGGSTDGGSNCLARSIATNLITYSMEPISIQQQTATFAAPQINWNSSVTYYIYDSNSGDTTLHLEWYPVVGATNYKVFSFHYNGTGSGNEYIFKEQKDAYNPQKRSLNGSMFTDDSGLISGLTYEQVLAGGEKNYFYLFAYKNGVRSSFPSTYVIDFSQTSLQLWPVVQLEYHGGSGFANFTDVTWRNLYTNQSLNVSSNDAATIYDNNAAPNVPQISANVPIFSPITTTIIP